MLDRIQPIVLVGGQSRRFGSDKLKLLVAQPARALREIFGPRVAFVGNCAEEVRAQADLSIPDAHPGSGPIGGIVSALRHARDSRLEGVFVLAGDLPNIDTGSILSIIRAAEGAPHAWVVLGQTTDLEPCIGLYRVSALEPLAESLAAAVGKPPSLMSVLKALPPDRLVVQKLAAAAAKNINTPEDLAT